MMAGLPWRLALTACFLSAVVTPGLSRSMPEDGICNRVKQYLPGEGRRAVDGMTLIYCATETDLLCRIRPEVQVCCLGWKKDPDSKELRCIKIDPSDSASIGTDLDNEEDFTGVRKVWNDLKREAGVGDSVIRPRGSRAAPESKTDQGGVNATDGQSVQIPKQVAQNGTTDPIANGTGNGGSGTEQGNQTNPPVVAGPAGSDANHSLTDGNQPAKPQSSGTGETHSGPDAASRVRLPPANNGDAEKLPTISSTTTDQEPSKDGSVPANGTASQLEGPPHVETLPESTNSATSHSAVNESEAESQTPAKNEHNTEHGGSVLTGAVAIVGSSVTNTSKSEALTSPSEQSGGNRASANESRAPATPPEQSSGNRASVNNSEVPTSPLVQSSDNHAGVNNSQPPTSTPAQSSDNHAGGNKNQALTSTPAQSSDNHATVNENQAPTSKPTQSSDNHAGVNKNQASTSTPAQSSNNHASVNNSDAPVVPPGQSTDIHGSVNPSQAPVTPMGQSGDNRANANKSEAPTSPQVQSSDNHASVSNNQPATSAPAQSSDNHAGVNKNEPPTSPPGQSGDSHASVNKSQTLATPPEQSGDNHTSVNKSEAPVSSKVQSDGNLTSVNNTGASAHVQPDQKTQDTTPLTLSSEDLVHGQHVEIVPSTDSTPVPPNPATSANVPLPEATTTNATGAAATLPPQTGTSHSSVPSVTAATPVIDRSGTTAGKPTVVPAPRHPNALAGNDTVEYSVMVGTNRSSGNRTPGASAGNNLSVPTGQQGAANTTEKNGNATTAANCTVAGHERNCTGANCSFPENQTVCNGTSQTVGAVNESEAESQTPAKNEHNTEHGGSVLTGAVAIVGSSVTNTSKSEALTSPSEQSGGNRASANESRAPATPPEQSSGNRASVNNSEVPTSPLVQSSDNHAGVNNSQPPTSTPAQSSDNHAGGNKNQALTSTPAQSSDNHATVNENQAPTSKPTQSSDNHAGVNKNQASTSTPAQSSNNHASVNNSDAPVVPPGQSTDIHGSVNPSQAPVTPMGQSGDNRANANKSEAPTSPQVQSSDNHASVSNNQPATSAPAQSSDNHAGVNKNEPPTSPPGQSGDSHASVNKSQTLATPPEQSGDNHTSVNKREAPVSSKVQSDGNLTSVNNTGASAHVQPDQKTQDTTPLTLSSEDLVHGQHVEIVPSTDSTPVPPNPATSANVPLPEATTTNATGAAATLPPQTGTSHSSVPSVTAATPVIDRSGTTAGKPTVVPAPRHPNALAGNDTVEYSVMVGTNRSSGNRTPGASAGNNLSVPTGQQGAANTTEKNGNATTAANCTVAGHERNCTGANCSFPENQTVCNGTSQTVGLQMPAAAKPQPHGDSPLPPSGSAAKTASEVTISLLLVTAVIFVAVLLYWRNRRRRRQYINCGTREPNLHFSNPVYDLEAMMEQTSLVKLQNAADIEDGDGDDSEHEAASQRK